MNIGELGEQLTLGSSEVHVCKNLIINDLSEIFEITALKQFTTFQK